MFGERGMKATQIFAVGGGSYLPAGKGPRDRTEQMRTGSGAMGRLGHQADVVTKEVLS